MWIGVWRWRVSKMIFYDGDEDEDEEDDYRRGGDDGGGGGGGGDDGGVMRVVNIYWIFSVCYV